MKHASLAAGAALVPGGWLAAQQAANYVGAALPEPEVPLYWLDGEAPKLPCGATWGVPWPKGQRKHVDNLDLQNQNGQSLPVQHGVLARWPDGSIKWSVHSTPPNIQSTARLRLQQGKATLPEKPLQVQAHGNTLVINTGALQCTINQQGPAFIAQCSLAGGVVATQGRLLLRVQNLPQPIPGQPLHTEELVGQVEHAVVEQKGPVLAVIKLSGQHVSASGKRLIPFVVRLYFYAGSQSMRMVHSMVYDADEQTTFINGLGVQFAVPLDDEPYNRHIRFGGQAAGVFAEAVQGLTGLRRDAGTAVRQAQMTGQQVPPVETWPAAVRQGLPYIPKFGDYTLSQLSSQGFTLKKRTSPQHGWVTITQGQRANGLAYLGTPKGGLAMGLQHFWQSHPAQLDVSDAHTPVGKLTLWLWSPEAPPMDLRFYHDGMGQDTYEKQLAGLDITYEDYEPGFGTPQGIARTSELMCWFLNSTPSNQTLAQLGQQLQAPPRLLPTSEYLYEAGAFAQCWQPKSIAGAPASLDAALDFYFEYYQKQVDQHHWYGFWNYGDVMHSYDADRHMWKYDIGGFAWDNSELSTDLWLWLYFLRSSRPEAFRMAEAMTRHTSEVDVHHLGPFAPLGSRHNVQHWGCSAKQLRISTVANRRIYYYLTADERMAQLMEEQVEAYRALEKIAPGRKLPPGDVQQTSQMPGFVNMGFGTDWGSVAAAWLTHVERTGNKTILQKLLKSMETIGSQPHGFFTGGAPMEVSTGGFKQQARGRISVSHLSAAFGLPEVCAELIQTFDMPVFEKAWLQYCRLYNAPAALQVDELGKDLGRLNLGQGHARLTAYAASRLQSQELANRAWQEFYRGDAGFKQLPQPARIINGPQVLQPVEESPGISTNAVAQWSLAYMQCLAWAGKPPQ